MDGRAEQPHLRHLRDQVHGELLFAMGVLDDGEHLFVDEVADGLADHQLVFGKERIDFDVVDAGERSHCPDDTAGVVKTECRMQNAE